MSKHTPGKWEFFRREKPAGPHAKWTIGVAATETDVAEVGTHGDAKLIAAAPDLLMSAKELVERVYWSGADTDTRSIVRMLEKAIAKAEGNQTVVK